ncbi:hypothetical protein QBC35DRAFT_495401 [Podospora australis]|uniref:Uncharacterized protein n=1 Tax=Podospora australis TaxID=1536484 RepID=A0AAN6WV03_9PEZI|nr:hypothetical protein QBC35DRAFT_495401 [Podospora australis]
MHDVLTRSLLKSHPRLRCPSRLNHYYLTYPSLFIPIMASTKDIKVRYSTANVSNSEATKACSWEKPVPVNNFWDSLDYCLARNFLGNFSHEELPNLPIDPDSTASHQEKLTLLLSLLQAKVEQEEALAAQSSSTLHEADYKKWHSLYQGIYTYQTELKLLSDAGKTIRMLVEKRSSTNDIPLHCFADHLITAEKDYKQAEEIEKLVLEKWEKVPQLGRDSPQCINARRIIARAVWMQGKERREEADTMIAEIEAITEEMRNGRFAAYLEEERKLNSEMMEKLKAEGPVC